MIQHRKDKMKILIFLLFFLITSLIGIFHFTGKQKHSYSDKDHCHKKQGVILFGKSVRIIENIDDSIKETRLSKLMSFDSTNRVKLLFDEKTNIFYLLEHSFGDQNIRINRLYINGRWLKSSLLFDGPYLNQTNIFYFKFYKDKSFIDGYGTVYKILNTKEQNVNFKAFRVSKDLYYSNKQLSDNVLSNEGGIHLPDGSAVFQYNNTVAKYRNVYGNGLMENQVVLCDKNGKIIKTWNEGYIPKLQGGAAEEDETPLPVSYLASRNKISLLIRFETPEYKWNSTDPVPVWLTVLDLNTNKLEKITPVNMEMHKGAFDRLLPLEWNIFKKREYIAFSAPSWLPEDDGKQISSTIIFDVQKKKIMKKFNWESRVLRWSPDGRYLAMLRMNTFEAMNSHQNIINDNVKQVGSLYIYDLKTDTIKKVTQDKTCFDFFWIDR